MRQLKITRSITSKDSRSLERYLHEIDKISMITPTEEIILAKKIKKGDSIALENLITANLRFVVSVAKQYQGNNLSLSDLIEEGNKGLIIAASRFNETMGFKFISYAVWWIRQSILKAIGDNGRVVRLPVNISNSINKINKVAEKFEQRFERCPSPEETAAELGEMTLKNIKLSMRNNTPNVYIDDHLNNVNGSSFTFSNLLTSDNPIFNPETSTTKQSLEEELKRRLNKLTVKEREIIELFFGINNKQTHTLTEIGYKLELTPERVRQIKKRAIRLMKLHRQNLKPFL